MKRSHRNELRYPDLWRAIDGAVRDAVVQHDDILIPDKRRSSIVKRAVGQVLSLKGLGAGKPAEMAEGTASSSPAAGADAEGVKGLAGSGGQPHRRKSRRKKTKGMFPWPLTGFGLAQRRALHSFIRKTQGRFIGLHQGPGDIVFVEVRRR